MLGDGNGGEVEREGVEGGGEVTEGETGAFVLGGGDKDDGDGGGDDWAGASGTDTGGDLVVG